MKNKFLARDYSQKLDGTFVRWKGVVHYCRVDGQKLILTDPASPRAEAKIISATDDDLDLSSIELGYFNAIDLKSAVYIYRCPFRKVKQGVAEVNIKIDHLAFGFTSAPTSYIHANGVGDGFNDKYPSLSSAVRMLKAQQWHSVGISHELALNIDDKKNINVFFRKDKIGTYNVDLNVVEIPSFSFSPVYSKLIANIPWVVK